MALARSAVTSTQPIKLVDGIVEKMQEQVRHDFIPKVKLAPGQMPMTVHFFDVPFMLGVWAVIRESTIVNGQFTRSQKEMLATFVSQSNECPFCTNAHRVMADLYGADGTFGKAADGRDLSTLSDRKTAAVAEWLVASQDMNSPELEKVPPFSLLEAPEIIGTALHFNYINRVVNTFMEQTTDGFTPFFPAWLKPVANLIPPIKAWVDGRILEKAFEGVSDAAAGEFETLIESDIAIPDDMKWLSINPAIQKACAYKTQACNELGEKYIPESVRNFVGNYIQENYSGGPPPLSRKWVDDATDRFEGSGAEKCAVRFMLLISFASFQIDDKIMIDLSKHYPEINTQKAMGIWASFKTAWKIVQWQSKAIQKLV